MSYQEWRTPKWFFDLIDSEFHFTLDVAASPINALCAKYFTREQDGLTQTWRKEIVWCNPPYHNVYPWVAKAYRESHVCGATVVMLLNPATDTNWFHDAIWDIKQHKPYPNVEVRFLKGRLQFLDQYGLPGPAPTKGNMLVIFRPPPLSSSAPIYDLAYTQQAEGKLAG